MSEWTRCNVIRPYCTWKCHEPSLRTFDLPLTLKKGDQFCKVRIISVQIFDL